MERLLLVVKSFYQNKIRTELQDDYNFQKAEKIIVM